MEIKRIKNRHKGAKKFNYLLEQRGVANKIEKVYWNFGQAFRALVDLKRSFPSRTIIFNDLFDKKAFDVYNLLYQAGQHIYPPRVFNLEEKKCQICNIELGRVFHTRKYCKKCGRERNLVTLRNKENKRNKDLTEHWATLTEEEKGQRITTRSTQLLEEGYIDRTVAKRIIKAHPEEITFEDHLTKHPELLPPQVKRDIRHEDDFNVKEVMAEKKEEFARHLIEDKQENYTDVIEYADQFWENLATHEENIKKYFKWRNWILQDERGEDKV